MRLGATSSLKWNVAVAPDGAGGAIVGWEENRGRVACCRDLRDLYFQRLDAGGNKLWGGEDLKLAEADSGEELLGLFPSPGGGALAVWHRGGRLLAQEITADGAFRLPMPGAVLREGEATCEWHPGHGAAAARGGAAVTWSERGPGGRAVLRFLRLTAAADGWRPGAAAAVAEEAGLRPSVLAATKDGWLAAWWVARPEGAELWGRELADDGTTRGGAFRIGAVPGAAFLHAEARTAADGSVWLLYGGVDPEAIPPEHELRVAQVRGRRVRGANAGRSKSSVMYIPSTRVTVGLPGTPPDGLGQSATPEFVSWRSTASLLPLGRDAAAVARLDAGRVQVTLIRAGGKSAASRPLALGTDVYTGFAPELLAGGGETHALWAEKSGEDRHRLVLQRIVLTGGVPAAHGASLLVAEESLVSPRVGAVAPVPGGLVLAWTAVHRGEWAIVRAQRLAIP